jgi:hypothetical protein
VTTRPRFEFAKWYADCVSGEGEVLIAYSGRLRHRRLAVQYESLLSAGESKHSLRRSSIECTPDRIEWGSEGLGLCGSWERRSAEIRETVFQSEDGWVQWHCVMPKAEARMNAVAGLGYAEQLRLTIPPWRLPIRRLRWGRFLSERNAVVWIDWEGEFRTRLVYANGRPAAAEAIENDGLTFADGTRLELDRGLVLRSGQLGSTVLHAIPGLKKLAPRMFLVDECKWRSHGRLMSVGEETDSGWCIHEDVRWP